MKRTGSQPPVPALAFLAALGAVAGIAWSTHGSGYRAASAAIVVPGASIAGAPAPAPLVELDPCGGSGDQTQAPAVQPGGGTQVSFRIVPSTVAQVDRSGTITAVATNTGCAPQSWNSFYVQTPDGAYSTASPSDVTLLLAATYSGDWTTPGLFHQFG
jgi:hypothetical protein